MMYKRPVSFEDTTTIFTEMFKRVGLEYTDEFIAEKEWYLKHTWTEKEQEDFRKWLGKFLTKKKYSRGKYREMDHGYYEAGKFIMDYGWRCSDA